MIATCFGNEDEDLFSMELDSIDAAFGLALREKKATTSVLTQEHRLLTIRANRNNSDFDAD